MKFRLLSGFRGYCRRGVRPYVACGHCLAPVMTAGTIVLVDSRLTAKEWDLICIEYAGGVRGLGQLAWTGGGEVCELTNNPPRRLKGAIVGVVVGVSIDAHPEFMNRERYDDHEIATANYLQEAKARIQLRRRYLPQLTPRVGWRTWNPEKLHWLPAPSAWSNLTWTLLTRLRMSRLADIVRYEAPPIRWRVLVWALLARFQL